MNTPWNSEGFPRIIVRRASGVPSHALSTQGIPSRVGRMLGMGHRCPSVRVSDASLSQDLSLSLNNGQAGLGVSLKVEAGDKASHPAVCPH